MTTAHHSLYPGPRLVYNVLAWMLIFLSSGSKPPCTIPKRFCSCGRACAALQRSSHRVVRWVASSKLPGRRMSQHGAVSAASPAQAAALGGVGRPA